MSSNSESPSKNFAWWAVTRRTSQTIELSKLGGGPLRKDGRLPGTIRYFQNGFISSMSHKISLDPYQPPSFGSRKVYTLVQEMFTHWLEVTGYSHYHVMQVHAHTLNFEMLEFTLRQFGLPRVKLNWVLVSY